MKNVLIRSSFLLVGLISISCNNSNNNKKNIYLTDEINSDTIMYYIDTLTYINKRFDEIDTLCLYHYRFGTGSSDFANFELWINNKIKYNIYYPTFESILLSCPDVKIINIPKYLKNRYNEGSFLILLMYKCYFFYYGIEFDNLNKIYKIKEIYEIIQIDNVIIDEIRTDLDTIGKLTITKINKPLDSLDIELIEIIQKHTPFEYINYKDVEFEYILEKDGNLKIF